MAKQSFIHFFLRALQSEIHHPYGGSGAGGHSGDFIFSDDSGIHVNNISNFSTSSSTTNFYEEIDSSYQMGPASLPIAPAPPTPAWHWNRVGSDRYNRYQSSGTPSPALSKRAVVAPMNHNNSISSAQSATPQQRLNQMDDSGPFIFGVHSNNCGTYRPVATTKLNERNESVINNNNNNNTKYSSIVTKRTTENSQVGISQNPFFFMRTKELKILNLFLQCRHVQMLAIND